MQTEKDRAEFKILDLENQLEKATLHNKIVLADAKAGSMHVRAAVEYD